MAIKYSGIFDDKRYKTAELEVIALSLTRTVESIVGTSFLKFMSID
ncbi:MAG: hypothetical protein ACM3X1_09040 [Ignavibacteriales bacterium]